MFVEKEAKWKIAVQIWLHFIILLCICISLHIHSLTFRRHPTCFCFIDDLFSICPKVLLMFSAQARSNSLDHTSPEHQMHRRMTKIELEKFFGVSSHNNGEN